MKSILENTFTRYLAVLISDFNENIKSHGKFSLTFDIWTSNTQTAYLGIINTYINSNFQLQYKLIG
jgi:hypothetical protein